MTSSTSIANTSGNKFNSVYFRLSKRFVGYWKMVSLPIVLLIFLSSNPQEDSKKGIITLPPTAQPEKGFVDNGKSPKGYEGPVNDLTAAAVKFPDENSRGLVPPNKKIILEKLVPDEKKEKNKSPVPLYSLVKNDCGEGYALDENGVCQKTIAVRSGKTFDADRRRKRHALSLEWLTQPKLMKQNSNGNTLKKRSLNCSSLYPGLGPDKNGGCMKVMKTSEQPFDKALPP